MTNRKLTTGLTLLAACSALTANAGTVPAMAPAPAPASTSLWSGSVTLGYDSDYIYRGVEIFGEGRAKHLVTGSVDLNYQINDRISWNFNAWYGSSAASNTSYDEQFEPGLEFFWTPCANTNVTFGAFYETESDAFYAELGANYTFKVCDKFSVIPGALISYVDRDSSQFAPSNSDFNHAALYIKAPYTFKPGVTLTPYIQYNIPLDGAEDAGDFLGNDQDNRFFGGATFSVAF